MFAYLLIHSGLPECGWLTVLWRRWVAQHFGLFGENQEGSGAACHVLRVQVSGRVFVQGTTAPKEEADGTLDYILMICTDILKYISRHSIQGVSSKNATNEVEIIRYQVLIPVTEVQVRASSAKDMDSHFLWELIHLRSQLQRRSEKVYVLSNSTADFRNAFLKTIRQIIRESVRNMSIPMKGMGSTSSIVDLPPHPRGGNSQTLERPKQQIVCVVVAAENCLVCRLPYLVIDSGNVSRIAGHHARLSNTGEN